MDPLYILLIVATLAIGLGATAYVNKQIKKYHAVPGSLGLTGAQMAHQMLSAHGITNVAVRRGGPDENHFDPRTNSIALDPKVFDGTSVTALATACHEVGHACQFAESYVPLKIRSALVPAVNLCSNLWIFLFIGGLLLNLAGLYFLAIIMYAVAVVFQLVTLPVEFNASSRAMTYLGSLGIMQQEQTGAYNVLRACALTYVAAALTSIMQLLYLLSARNSE